MRIRRLVIVSAVIHHQYGGVTYAYGPYAREIEIWAELFPEIAIAAPVRETRPPGDALPFLATNIVMLPQFETGGIRVTSKALQLATVPLHICRLAKAMSSADAIQVRCPGNLGLLGCMLAPFFNKPRIAKYAGQWSCRAKEPLTWRWQKALLRSKRWGAPVLVYGKLPKQPAHVIPVFASVMDRQQMERASKVARTRSLESFSRVLFVGRLTAERNVDILLQAIGLCRRKGVNLSCRIVGDGEMRTPLEQETQRLGLSGVVTFAGALPFDRVMGEYADADVLVLVAESEGWGKSIVEGMAFGLVCIGGNRGPVPWILGEGRGLVVEPRDVPALANALTQLHSNAQASAHMSRLSSAWAQQYSIEALRDLIRSVVESAWRVNLAKTTSQIQKAQFAV